MKSIVVDFDMLETGKVSPARHKRTCGNEMFNVDIDLLERPDRH